MQSLGRPLLAALSDLFDRLYGNGRQHKSETHEQSAAKTEESSDEARVGEVGGDEPKRHREESRDRQATGEGTGRRGSTASFLSLEALQESTDKHARKVLFRCRPDDARVEAVALAFPNHVSLCISSQAGCAFNCSFCSVGKSGFLRQLSADEITDQVLFFLRQGIKIDSVSLMGMGEPLANPKVFDALRILTDPLLFNFSARKLAVSTLGVLPGIKKLTEEHPQVNLAFSLHSPFPEERNLLVSLP
uniref:Ribosomal RNA large subunit methyltransferase Cfr n=1 Tax=Neospora caninum (strain Liverpool) TaxID=572307 RepID=A0A0F7UDK6_NEOCL|nr:TPA: Ribosomal RNA large subunit methyltransferase Cfr [Neospora caninum Liverpool]